MCASVAANAFAARKALTQRLTVVGALTALAAFAAQQAHAQRRHTLFAVLFAELQFLAFGVVHFDRETELLQFLHEHAERFGHTWL